MRYGYINYNVDKQVMVILSNIIYQKSDGKKVCLFIDYYIYILRFVLQLDLTRVRHRYVLDITPHLQIIACMHVYICMWWRADLFEACMLYLL